MEKGGPCSSDTRRAGPARRPRDFDVAAFRAADDVRPGPWPLARLARNLRRPPPKAISMNFRAFAMPWTFSRARFLFAGALLGSCLLAPARAAEVTTRTLDSVIATVEGEILCASDLDYLAWEERLRGAAARRLPEEEVRAQLLSRLLDEILVARWAEEKRIEPNEEEVERGASAALRELSELAPTPAIFEAWLRAAGYTMEDARAHLTARERRLALIRAALAPRISAGKPDGSAAMEGGDTRPVRFRLRLILIATPASADDRETSAAFTRALALRREILAGLPFREAARLRSDDIATRDSGGDAGWLDRAALHPALAEAVERLRPGEISAPIRVARGWNLAQLVDFETPASLFHQRRAREEFRALASRLREEATIRLAPGVRLARPEDLPAPEDTPDSAFRLPDVSPP